MSGAPAVLLLRSTLKVWPALAVHATTTTSVGEAVLLRPGIPNTETSTKSQMHNMTKRFIFKLLSELAIHRSRDGINQFGNFGDEQTNINFGSFFKIDDALFRLEMEGCFIH
jgi:hypothetical protein